jgi:TonB-linked SusC/RagA family outer membrane protein
MKKSYESGGGPCLIPKKLLLVMKLTAFLIILFTVQVTATVYSQNKKLTIDARGSSIKEVLQRIEEQSEYRFIYENEKINLDEKVNIRVKDEVVENILKMLFEKDGVNYSITENNLILINPSSLQMKSLGKENNGTLQQKSVTGRVIDNTGNTLPGVSVVIKGTTNGTITDIDGNYTLAKVSDNSVLIFSFVGMITQEIAVGSKTLINVQLSAQDVDLDEVVVTALGIKRDKKALAYSMTEVKGDEFIQAREINVANALTGKIAGVNATGMSTGPGGSSRIVIRGNGSFNGDNQPLYVVNGMPIDNSTPGGTASANGGGLNIDRGDGISGINPDDIESISVLKGGTASALYGSRASNGVILITTKKGKAQKGIGVEFNSSMTYDTPLSYQDFQYEYGHGKLGRKPLTQAEAISWGRHSWGAKIDGQQYVSIDGKQHAYSPVYASDNMKDFYRTGSTLINTVAFTGGTEAINFRLSLSNTGSKGVLPSTKLEKNMANLNVNAKLGSKITIETVSQFNNEEVNNRSMAGDANGNPNWIAMLANTIDAQQLAPGYLPNGFEFQWNETPYATNPYFVINRYKTNDKKNRFIGQASIKYDLAKNLYIKGSINRDFYSFDYYGIIPTGTQYTSPAGAGEYHGIRSNVSETNSMVTANYNTKFLKDFNVNVMGGANRRSFQNNETYIDGTQFVLPFFYSYTNMKSLTVTPNNQRSETNSVFGSIDMDYKNIVFLTLTGRKDWFSTLNPSSNSIFYPSIGGSILLSEALNMPKAIKYMKLRGSWAQVGGAVPDAYAVNLTYSMMQGGHNGRALEGVTSTTITDPNLRPLTSTTKEIGLETKLFDSRLGFDVTLYDRKTSDDIVQTAIPITSGYSYARLNAGELQNKGIEVLVSGVPVKTKRFSWDVSYNMAYNKSKVLKLTEGLNTIQMASSVGGWAGVYNEVGRPFGIIKGYRMVKNATGSQVFASSGYEKRSDLVELGQGVAPLSMGLTNTFTYKRYSLNILIDGKFGNKVFSVMNTYANRFGLLKRTLNGRGDAGLTLTGVDEAGNPYQRNISYTTDAFRLYYDNQKNYSELFTYDGGFVKLRQIIFSYDIPSEVVSFLRVKSASISFVARNVAILYKNTEGFDPEVSITNGNAQGFESFALPRTRNLGFNLLVKF